ncbi:Hypothetical Protein FCC1311_087532 [Hondaea fermentalgiana]|uniref:Uncharacterized protein n=1 Tax=Hondaea fermentalgiana TaxID=2315210 RepID=A0A2R5GQE1_9STRA|nr:Hypothetical Protein FCC1311_087532 [Hondaea fermentalgiana]|eukprot:GBG32529.1 Hypothetical Protein FCC1311_087532 [Hondaea fermentalgiana]
MASRGPRPAQLFQRSRNIALADRTVGVVARDDQGIMEGYVLYSAGTMTYLIDSDGGVVHEWESSYVVFAAYLLENGHLIRDGNENIDAPIFRLGGAAGRVEEVDWDGTVLWTFSCEPLHAYISHHALQILPNGNCLMLVWERKTKEEAILAGRRPDLLPDGEMLSEIVLELKPDVDNGTATVAWRWNLWDHLVQDFDASKENYGDIAASPHRLDINCCPTGGKPGQRDQIQLDPRLSKAHGDNGPTGKTGEKDWCHINSVAYCPQRDQIALSFNVHGEIMLVDHSTTTEEASTSEGGQRGKGGDILLRFGNPKNYRRGTRLDQLLFCQHDVSFIPQGVPGAGHLLVFNNGRKPDRLWSTVDEYKLPEDTLWSGDYLAPQKISQPVGPQAPCWRFGPSQFRLGSFYCTNISGARRLENGNTIVNQGPLGIFIEVDAQGREVWRYVCPAVTCRPLTKGAITFVRQGDFPPEDAPRHFFIVNKYPVGYAAFQGKALEAYRYVEA